MDYTFAEYKADVKAVVENDANPGDERAEQAIDLINSIHQKGHDIIVKVTDEENYTDVVRALELALAHGVPATMLMDTQEVSDILKLVLGIADEEGWFKC